MIKLAFRVATFFYFLVGVLWSLLQKCRFCNFVKQPAPGENPAAHSGLVEPALRLVEQRYKQTT